MHIIYDPHFDEYGVLMNENFKKVLKKTHADFSKVAPTLGPEFVFPSVAGKIINTGFGEVYTKVKLTKEQLTKAERKL